MDRRLLSGSLAALAAVTLVCTGTGATDAAFDDRADVPGNSLAAGALTLRLTAGNSAAARLVFADLEPGGSTRRQVWVATNDVSSSTPATMSVTLRGLRDLPAPCAVSRGKALGEIASGVAGCVLGPAGPSGTPVQGNLSRLLDVSASYDPAATDPATCAAGTSAPGQEIFARGPGNLRTLAAPPAGTTVRLRAAGGAELRLAPGQGVCISVAAFWPPGSAARPAPESPVDDAAQGDSLSVEVRVALEQVHP